MVNATMKTFGYPVTLIREYAHWCVLLRPAQATLGALVLVCKDDADAFSKISPEAFGELATVTAHIETALDKFRPYQRLNYLMLMMVDRDVHFHVLPRYEQTQSFADIDFPDSGWPKVPELSQSVTLEEDVRDRLIGDLRGAWPA